MERNEYMKQYMKDYRQEHGDKLNRRRREQRAVGFSNVDETLQIEEGRKRVKKLFKQHDTPLPKNLVIIVSCWDAELSNVNRIPVPAKGINNGCTVAVFNKPLTQVGLIGFDKFKDCRHEMVSEIGGVNYEVPPTRFKWFDLQEEAFRG